MGDGVVSVVGRLRKLEERMMPAHANVGEVVLRRGMLPLLADVVEAAAQLSAEIEEDEQMDGECRGRCDSYALPEDELHVGGCPILSLRAVLVRLSEQLDREEP